MKGRQFGRAFAPRLAQEGTMRTTTTIRAGIGWGIDPNG
jgi:hypothetical protein